MNQLRQYVYIHLDDATHLHNYATKYSIRKLETFRKRTRMLVATILLLWYSMADCYCISNSFFTSLAASCKLRKVTIFCSHCILESLDLLWSSTRRPVTIAVGYWFKREIALPEHDSIRNGVRARSSAQGQEIYDQYEGEQCIQME
jgi:uncharacterized membrane protein YwzB